MRIAITGADGTGKSTLGQRLADQFSLIELPTPGRLLAAKGLPTCGVRNAISLQIAEIADADRVYAPPHPPLVGYGQCPRTGRTSLYEACDTRDTLHVHLQIVGKVRLALAPMAPQWEQVPLYVTAHVWGTKTRVFGGNMPFAGGTEFGTPHGGLRPRRPILRVSPRWPSRPPTYRRTPELSARAVARCRCGHGDEAVDDVAATGGGSPSAATAVARIAAICSRAPGPCAGLDQELERAHDRGLVLIAKRRSRSGV